MSLDHDEDFFDCDDIRADLDEDLPDYQNVPSLNPDQVKELLAYLDWKIRNRWSARSALLKKNDRLDLAYYCKLEAKTYEEIRRKIINLLSENGEFLVDE